MGTGLLRGIDVSNWQPADLTAIIKAHGIKHVVVRAFMPWEKPSNDHAVAQIASARANGCTVGIYVWCYRNADPEETIYRTVALMTQWGIKGPLWLDCETYTGNDGDHDLGPDGLWLEEAKAEADGWKVKLGIYSGRWFVTSFIPGYVEFADWPLWLADYNGQPNLDGIEIPAGWNRDRLLGHQYSDKPVDLDVFSRRVLT